MKNHNRRVFLGQMLKGAAIGMLSLFPGTFFNRGISFAAGQSEDTLESVLKRVTKNNLYRELNKANLSPEEKFAIAAVKEIPREQLKETIEKMRKGGPVAETGYGCGLDCGSICGHGCGVDCGSVCNVAVVDQKGSLDIKLNLINKSKFRNTLEKALQLIK